MGIYIPDMEMPKDGQMLIIFPDGTAYVCFNGMRERLAQVEAVSVPPHGRLIDADKIGLTDFEIILCQKGNPFKNALKMLLEKIENAPTIIPASEEKMK